MIKKCAEQRAEYSISYASDYLTNMPGASFEDLRRHLRCPYAYRLDRTDAFPDKITMQECLDRSVRDTIAGFSRSRIMGDRMKEEKVLDSFWKHWDDNFPKVYDPNRLDPMQFIRLGEKCVRNFVYQSTRFGAADIIASHMEGTFRLSEKYEILIDIEEVGRRGTTAYVTRYITDTKMLSKEQLAGDHEMMISALWAMDNLNAREVVMRWVFLIQSTVTELTAFRKECSQSVPVVLSQVDELIREKEPLPRETVYCNECPYQSRCPRFLHELSVRDNGKDEGTELANQYLEIEAKKQALKNRIEVLDAEQDLVRAKIVAYSDSRGYMSLKGDDGKLLIRHEKKAELPQDKTELIARLKETGDYDRLSMPNYSRIRSDIVKGTADPKIIEMSEVSDIDKIYVKKKE